MTDTPLRSLGFLTIGTFSPDDPAAGHEATLEMIELGERLGFDSAWLRHRHLQYGISSPVAVMAAASQRTRRIQLGTAVTPLGWENPLRLAEDLATVDVLSGGRINPGFSVGEPMQYDTVRDALYPDSADAQDFTHARVQRLVDFIAGEPVRELSGKHGVVEEYSARVEPHSPGLRDRLWYGAGSMNSARRAGEAGLNLLSSSVVFPDADQLDSAGSADFAQVQREQIRAFRMAHPRPDDARVSQGLVVIPTDSATPAQRRKYQDYVAARTPRTSSPQGPSRVLYAPDLIGSCEQIAQQLQEHAGYREVNEVAFALPFSFEPEDYRQILGDIAEGLGPALGWVAQD